MFRFDELLSRLTAGEGRRYYRLTIENGRMTGISEIKNGSSGDAPSDPASPYLSPKEAAKRLGHSYTWLSRNWKSLGLRPSRVGNRLFYRREEIERFIAEHPHPDAKGRRAPRMIRAHYA